MDAWIIFLSGMIIGMIIMAVAIAASNVRWSCRDDEDDLISRKGLVEYLNLDNYDDTDGIKVKYIRQFINKKEN